MDPVFSRRDLLRGTCCTATALTMGKVLALVNPPSETAFEARDYEHLEKNKTRCLRCPRQCILSSGQRGYCRVRESRDGRLYSSAYGRVAACNIDPIEKKPLFHFLPGSLAYSLATVGCNLKCKFCQNYQISQASPEDMDLPFSGPQQIAAEAKEKDCRVIAFTYTEPVVFSEYAEDIASEGKKYGLKSVSISNGFIRKKPLLRLCEKLDAIKIDLKSFRESFYREVCSAQLGPVLDSLVTIRSRNRWLEIVNLVIPTLNDSPSEIRDMCRWICREIGPDTPLHFSRFQPQYRLKNLPPTPLETLDLAWKEARNAGLRYVYLGNVPGHEAENTYCHKCGKKIISRYGFWIKEAKLQNGKCGFCNEVVPGVWN